MAIDLREAASLSSADDSGERRIGEILQESGSLNSEDVDRVLSAQREESNGYFGDIALRMGIITEREMHHALARQSKFPYVLAGRTNIDPALTAAYEPFGRRAEELRVLRSELILRWFGRDNTTLAIIGARRTEGASVLAANLALVFAQLGERTLLIDGNMRCPGQHLLFGIGTGPGLSELLNGQINFTDAISAVPGFDSLSILRAGSIPPNPQELLGRVSFAYLLETLPSRFDVIIVDTPPTMDAADAQLIAARTRGVLIAARRHQTRIADIRRMQRQLESTEAIALGVVIDE